MLDHPYCAKLLEVKIKKEQEELMDRLKNGSGASCHNNPLPPVIQKPLFKHSIETILSSPSTNSMTQVITESIIPKVENNILFIVFLFGWHREIVKILASLADNSNAPNKDWKTLISDTKQAKIQRVLKSFELS